MSLVAAFIAAGSEVSGAAILEKRFGKWVERDHAEIAAQAGAVAAGLRAWGIGAGDRVALISGARLEWITSDLGIQATGAACVALPSDIDTEGAVEILTGAGARTVVVEGQDQADVVLSGVEAGSLAVDRIVYIEPAGVAEYTSELLHSFADLLEAGAAGSLAAPESDGTAALVTKAGGRELVEVSGSTIAQSARSTIDAFSLGPKDRVVSLRDIADPVERGATVYPALLSGAMLALPENAATADAAVHEIAPTFVHVTERWLTQQAAQITVRFDQNRGLKSLLAWAWGRRTSGSLERYGSARPARGVWRWTVSLPVLEKLGLEKARAVVESGDPSPKELIGFYRSLGLPVQSALTLPELSGFAAVGSGGATDGFVGAALPGVTASVRDARLIVTTETTGEIDTGLDAAESDGGLVVGVTRPEHAAETRLRAVPVISAAFVAPGGGNVIVELEGAIASRWATNHRLDAATYRSFSRLPEMQEGVETIVAAVLGRFDLSADTVHILPQPLHEISGALGFGDVAAREVVAALV